jgi:outer membrane usher protein
VVPVPKAARSPLRALAVALLAAGPHLVDSAGLAALSAPPAPPGPPEPPAGERAEEPAPRRAREQRAFLELVVNGVAREPVLVVLRAGDAWIEVRALAEAGVAPLPPGRREVVDGAERVSLASLAPEVTFEVAEEDLALRLTVAPHLLGRTVIDLEVGPPPGTVYSRNTSAFLNYSLSWRDFDSVDLFGELGLSAGRGLLLTTFTAGRNTAGDGPDQREDVVRGLTRWTLDQPRGLRRWTLGDRLATAGSPLGGSVILGGVGVSREFGLDPYFVRFPSPDLAGTLLAPAEVEVYVNGLLVRRERLPPGEFEIRNLPAPAGLGQASLVIRDAAGAERRLELPFYVGTRLLGEGLSEYGYDLGLRREGFGRTSFDYGEAAFLGRHRLGLSDRLTVGAHLEAAEDLVSGGPSAALAVPFGEVSAGAALSSAGGADGWAGALDYSFSGRRWGFGASLRGFSPHFAHLSLPAETDRPRLDASVFVGLPLGRWVDVGLQAGRRDLRDGATRDDVRLSASWLVAPRLTVLGAVERIWLSDAPEADELLGEQDTRALVALNYSLGARTTARAIAGTGRGAEGVAIGLQRSLPVGEGFGYRLEAASSEELDTGSGQLQAQGRYGRATLSHLEADGGRVTILNLSGALMAIGGSVYAGRPVQDAFAVVRVPGVPGVRAYRSHQQVGRTGGRGDLLVPNLLSNYGNRLSIADEDVPLDYVVAGTEIVVAPPTRGGALVRFPVRPLRAFTGTLVLAAGDREPAPPKSGRLRVRTEAGEATSPIGGGGRFYLEDLPPGSHPAVIEWEGGTCPFDLTIPRAGLAHEAAPVTDLGRIGPVPCPEDGSLDEPPDDSQDDPHER